MVKKPWDAGSESIVRAEHISPDKSGDNIEAKKVALFGFDSTPTVEFPLGQWRRTSVDANGNQNVNIDMAAEGIATSANQTNGTQVVKVKETTPVDALKTNGSVALGYTGSNLTTLTKTIGGVSYRKTLTYTGSVLDSISAWVQI